MPGTPVTVNGPFTLTVDGNVVMTCPENVSGSLNGSYTHSGNDVVVQGHATVACQGSTVDIPAGKTGTLCGPGLGMP